MGSKKFYKLKKASGNVDYQSFFPYRKKYIEYHNPAISNITNFILNSYTLQIQNRISLIRSLVMLIFKKKKIFRLSKAYFVTDNYSLNYFHWINDVLPKIYYLEKEKLEEIVLLSEKVYEISYVKDSLKCFKINFKVIRKDEYIYVKKLSLLGSVAGEGGQNPELMQGVVRNVKQFYNISEAPEKNKRKIYITRKNESTRRTLPIGELESFLAKKGYNLVVAEKLSFKEQVELFSKCSHLIGVHGAGLTNMIFLEPKSKILEIKVLEENKNYCYYFLASAFNLSFNYFLGKIDKNILFQKSDIFINIKDFETSVNIFEQRI